jgi:hypothetical protein
MREGEKREIIMPYSGKFSRGPIFAVFAYKLLSMEIRPAKN